MTNSAPLFSARSTAGALYPKACTFRAADYRLPGTLFELDTTQVFLWETTFNNGHWKNGAANTAFDVELCRENGQGIEEGWLIPDNHLNVKTLRFLPFAEGHEGSPWPDAVWFTVADEIRRLCQLLEVKFTGGTPETRIDAWMEMIFDDPPWGQSIYTRRPIDYMSDKTRLVGSERVPFLEGRLVPFLDGSQIYVMSEGLYNKPEEAQKALRSGTTERAQASLPLGSYPMVSTTTN